MFFKDFEEDAEKGICDDKASEKKRIIEESRNEFVTYEECEVLLFGTSSPCPA